MIQSFAVCGAAGLSLSYFCSTPPGAHHAVPAVGYLECGNDEWRPCTKDGNLRVRRVRVCVRLWICCMRTPHATAAYI